MERKDAIKILEQTLEVAMNNNLDVMLLFSRREAIKQAIMDMKMLDMYNDLYDEVHGKENRYRLNGDET